MSGYGTIVFHCCDGHDVFHRQDSPLLTATQSMEGAAKGRQKKQSSTSVAKAFSLLTLWFVSLQVRLCQGTCRVAQ